VEPSGRSGDEIRLFVPRGTAIRALPQPEASIFPSLEVDDLDQAHVDPVRSGIEISGEPESDGAWTWLKVRAPGGNVHSRGAQARDRVGSMPSNPEVYRARYGLEDRAGCDTGN
jgi:hypothetical protein